MLGESHGVVANVLDYDIVVISLNSNIVIMFTFGLNTLGKDMNSLIPSAIGK